MNSKRILKMSGALLGGQGIQLATQFILPPLFLKSYGVATYGEWLTLSATVSYLGTLNFGLQTFANNEAGIASNRGDTNEVNFIQATALAILLAIVATAALLTSTVFILPLASWMKLNLTNVQAAAIAYLLGIQILARMTLGFFTGCYLVAAAAHRGQGWNNLLSIVTLIGTAGAAIVHSSLAMIAAVQLIAILVFILAVSIDLRIRAPQAVPNLRYARTAYIQRILKPSGYFAMLYSSNFLVYQLPVLIMNRLLGPASVVVFSLTRTIFSMSRAVLNALSQALQPEIVELYGKSSWQQLHRLYDLSERAVFALTPIVSMGTFVACPFLMAIWLHKPELYNAQTAFLMALISAVMGLKEHKYVFQTSANRHSEMARGVFISYAAMVAASWPAVRFFHITGFLVLWLSTEAWQLASIMQMNKRLFAPAIALDFVNAYRVCILLPLTALICLAISLHFANPKATLTLAALSTMAICASALASHFLFGLAEIKSGLSNRFLSKA